MFQTFFYMLILRTKEKKRVIEPFKKIGIKREGR